MPETQRLLSTAQVAELLGVSTRTIHRMAKDGRLRYVQKLDGASQAINSAYVFEATDVLTLAAELAEARAT